MIGSMLYHYTEHTKDYVNLVDFEIVCFELFEYYKTKMKYFIPQIHTLASQYRYNAD